MTDLGEEEDTAVDEPGDGEEDGGEEGDVAELRQAQAVCSVLPGYQREREVYICIGTQAGEAAAAAEEEGAEGEVVEAVDEEPGGHGWVTFSLHEAKYNAEDGDNQGDHLSGEVASQRLEQRCGFSECNASTNVFVLDDISCTYNMRFASPPYFISRQC